MAAVRMESMDQSTISQLEQDLEENKDHLDSAPDRVRDYYENPSESELDIAPHDLQFQQAAQYIEFAVTELRPRAEEWDSDWGDIDQPIEWIKRRDWSKSKIEDILYGISMELIVSAIHLKLKTENYLEKLTQNSQTPHISESTDCVLNDLEGDLGDSQIREIELVLELAAQKRNNLVHFGFHYQGSHHFPALFIDVGGYLITRYADTDEIPELEGISQYRADYAEQRSEAELYPEVSVGIEPL